MAFLLPNVQPSLLAQSKSKKDKANLHQTLSPQKPTSQFPISSTTCSSSLQTSTSQVAKVSTPHDKQQQQPKDEFYLNLGLDVRTIREDLPLIFIKDLNYDIYRFSLEFGYFRDDITFMDPLNTFTGIEKYKLIFWALRFHGKILFREIALDNIKPVSVLDLVTACPASPNPTFLWGPVDAYSSSWITFYKAIRETLDQERSLLPQDGLATCS
ncbi:hypothetical protein JHK85_022009 [Glycine max]|nr:hypothetical protein JHK85_022009 [Glycine max]